MTREDFADGGGHAEDPHRKRAIVMGRRNLMVRISWSGKDVCHSGTKAMADKFLRGLYRKTH